MARPASTVAEHGVAAGAARRGAYHPAPMRAATLAATATGAAWSAPALAPVCAPVCRALHVTRTISGPDVALTFDDGPHGAGTPAVLEVLASAGATATFFLVG